MTTNNHPANGPVSLDRLHQIREILSKAAAQSDGGNLGYAMADAVKVIDGVISAENAKAVVPEEMPAHTGPREFGRPQAYVDGWNAFRAAMLQAGNSPASPDGWIPVSERVPEQYVEVMVCTDAGSRYIAALNRQMNWDDGDFFDDIQNVTHWMPLPVAPQQEVK
ncbi:MAG: DUF551 domain-containing protein [Citrobacter freundii]|nr:DUF551 domain-containing protein [Citrobacter freundii]MDU1699691.1 DUF551 domain-containing protein [Citrobacter freundii]MDU1733884.1 DUF551 domain-containing protein [Citrobacter freundii]MDU1815990.1 DUF551 domain-containing protein [Citrobacter freundii]MDU7723252.1 DUF551 domain-containing protein [Citrobacter sp.]